MQAFKKHLKSPDFNLFLHCVSSDYQNSNNDESENKDVRGKVDSILKQGLDLDGNQERCPYGSISGTAMFAGKASTVKVSDVVDYSFSHNSRYVNTIVLAIPKYINIGNRVQEFSSLKGSMPRFERFKKSCLLDVSKEKYLPPEFIFGYQVVDRETNEVAFWQNNQHFALLPKAKQDKIMYGFATRIANVFNYCKNRYNVDKLEDVLSVMTAEHMVLLEDYLNNI